MPNLVDLPIIAVFPVLVGPLQTLLALLPAILFGVGSMLLAVFKPGGFVTLVRFVWRQKLFLGTITGLVVAWQYGLPSRLVQGQAPSGGGGSNVRTSWDSGRGGTARLGRGPGDADPTAPGLIWSNRRDSTVLSSAAVSGDRVIFSTATGIGPFSPEGRGALVCVDAHSGREIWRYAPENYRATFSSPVVSGDSVVCGEGLHQIEDARVTCLDLQSGQRRWEFRTKSHVESTAAIADGRVFIGAGSDGFYCLSLDPDPQGQPVVLWHLPASEFADCESSPVVSDGVVYFGLGEGGNAVCAVKSETGDLLWKLATPYPVFAPPTIAMGKLLIATGNGNYVQSAADLMEMKLQILRDSDATEQQLAEARERLKPVGEVWSIDLKSRQVDWKFTTNDAILGAIVWRSAEVGGAATEERPEGVSAKPDDASIFFGSRDGNLYRVSRTGALIARYDLHEPVIASPALGWKHVYCTSASGRLFCLDQTSLKPVWDTALGPGATFSSSPVVAHQHVYIGTAQQGLCCLGKPGEPESPVWAAGERGGSSDEIPVPEGTEVLWHFPAADDPPFLVSAPMMPLGNAVFIAGLRSGQSEVVKLNLDASEPAQRQSWSRKFEGTLNVSLVGCGERLCLVERNANSHVLKFYCLATSDGRILWSHTITGQITKESDSSPQACRPGISLDRQRVYVWLFSDKLACFDLVTGKALWIQNDGTEGRHGFGLPAAADDLVIGITESPPLLSAFDALTGIRLWQVPLQDTPTGSPLISGPNVLVPAQNQVAEHRIVDGGFLRSLPASDPSVKAPIDSNEIGNPVVPVIAVRGRAYVATDRGRIVCLGAATP